jgi:hypothetical protein
MRSSPPSLSLKSSPHTRDDKRGGTGITGDTRRAAMTLDLAARHRIASFITNLCRNALNIEKRGALGGE